MTTPTPLDDVEFLARSPHRVEVLRRLHEGPWGRPDLHDETGISQPTLGRVLGSLEERHWVEHRGREYELTALGGLVAEEFIDLLDTIETVQQLDDIVPLLPIEKMDLDVRSFGSARVTAPRPGDMLAHVRRIEEIVYEAGNLRLIVDTVAPGTHEDQRNRIASFMAGDQRVESIVAGDLLEPVLEDPELAGGFRDILELDRIELYRYDGPIPIMLAVADGTGVLVPKDDHGFPAAVIETDNQAVLAWIEARLDGYREQSVRLTPENMTGDPPR